MTSLIKSIINENVHDKIVFIRADLNTPISNGKVLDHTRVERLIPTINFLKLSGAKIVICSHLGRPKGKFNKEFTLKPLVEILSKILETNIHFSNSCVGQEVLDIKMILKAGEILLLENVRFHEEETKNDLSFAKKLSEGCDMFVNDAFSCSHRAHASLHAITNFLPAYSGVLLDQEMEALTSVLSSPIKPVAALVGGAKISTKINIIQYLITKMDYLIIGGAMANTFLVAQGLDVGKSLFEKDSVSVAKSILNKSWIQGNYGAHPIIISTPDVLKRIKTNDNNQNFEWESLDKRVSIFLTIESDDKKIEQENTQSVIDELIIELKENEATNLLTKQEEIFIEKGSPSFKIFVSFDYIDS